MVAANIVVKIPFVASEPNVTRQRVNAFVKQTSSVILDSCVCHRFRRLNVNRLVEKMPIANTVNLVELNVNVIRTPLEIRTKHAVPKRRARVRPCHVVIRRNAGKDIMVRLNVIVPLVSRVIHSLNVMILTNVQHPVAWLAAMVPFVSIHREVMIVNVHRTVLEIHSLFVCQLNGTQRVTIPFIAIVTINWLNVQAVTCAKPDAVEICAITFDVVHEQHAIQANVFVRQATLVMPTIWTVVAIFAVSVASITIVKIPKFVSKLDASCENVWMHAVNSSVVRMHFVFHQIIDQPVFVRMVIREIQAILKSVVNELIYNHRSKSNVKVMWTVNRVEYVL